MKKRQNLILRSFGASEIQNPDPDKLSKWILEEKRVCRDLISYKIESQIKEQIDYVDLLCSGGIFYRQRIEESLTGIKSGFLTDEPDAELDYFKLDAERIFKHSKNASFAFPSPSMLKIDDAFYNDRSDFIAGLCYAYSKIMRTQRDCGIKGHIIISNHFDVTELEELSHEHAYFFSPEGNSKALKLVLEYQNSIAIMPKKLPVVFELLNEYEIKKIAVIDGNSEDFEICLNYFDPENIICGGFCNLCEENYWKTLKEKAFVMK